MGDFSLHNQSLKFLQKSNISSFSLGIHENHIPCRNSKANCGVFNRPIFAYLLSKVEL